MARYEAISHALYPRVLDDFFESQRKFEDVSMLDTPTYFYGLLPREEMTSTVWPPLRQALHLALASRPSTATLTL